MRFSWDPIYDSASIGTLLTVLVLVLLFTVTPSGINRSRYWSLIALRVVAAIALLLTMIRPALISTDNRPTASTLVVAIDQSRSMTLASGESPSATQPPGSTTNAETRWDQQFRVLKSLSERFDSIDESLNLSLVSYDENAAPQANGPANEMSTWLQRLGDQMPDGNLTDLAAPLRSATTISSTNPLAGVVLLSDGTQTAFTDRNSNNAISAADLIAAIGVPLWTVALGPSAQGTNSRDVAITALPDTYRMFSGNETEVAFTVNARGCSNQTISVALAWVDADGESTPAATRTVTPASNDETTPMRIPLIAPEPGRYQLVAQASSPAGETDISNNRQIAFVRVQSGGGRILYVEGTPRLEQMFLRRSVRRFPDMELTYRWIPRDTSNRWPIDLAGDLQPGRFDIIILGDLHSAALGKKQLEQIAQSVADGTALVTLGGERAYGPGGYGDSPLAQVLPIKMDASELQPAGEVFNRPAANANPANAPPLPGQVGGPSSLIPTRNHPITTITTPSTNWSTLPETLGANQWLGARTAPGVQVLLESQQRQPMLVVGEYGRGRVASLAFDSTWTWWRGGASEFHRRFWRQLMLWLLSREDTDETDIQLEMVQRRFLASEGSEFTASLVSPSSATSQAPLKMIAEIKTEQGEIISVPANIASQTAGEQMTGEQTTTRLSGSTPNAIPPGIHTLQVRTEGLDAELSETIAFQITDDTRELTASLTDHSQLQRLAEATAGSGGKSFRADQVDELFDRIAQRQRRAERVVIDKYRLGDDPASGWVLFVLFAGALSTEWYLRRRWGLA